MASGYDIGVSSSTSSAADSGHTGAFNVTSGGGKQSLALYIVAGVVILFALIAWMKKGK